MALYLIPTPINETSGLPQETIDLIQTLLKSEAIICVEEAKEGRRRWLRFGLEREYIEKFVLFNEHTRAEQVPRLIKQLRAKRDVILMSDCGVPAFCDPGARLVSACHENGIEVKASYFANSVILALMLSGIIHEQFDFDGFIPVKKQERLQYLKQAIKKRRTSIIMDTPYRLKALLEQLVELGDPDKVFLGVDLSSTEQELYRGRAGQILKKMSNFKREFVMVLGDYYE